MKIVIAGAGAVGSHLAALLSREDQDIILIDENPEKTARLLNSGDLDLMTLNVSPTSISGLREGGVHQCDLFIAVTPEETRNITCCMLAHTLGARKTIARVDTAEYTMPQYRDLFQQMGVNSIIYPEGLAAREILDGIKRSWVRQYWEVAGGALVMLGIKLREKARITGVALRDLCDAQTPYRIVVIKRGDDTIIPSGNDQLRVGDIAYFMTTKRHIGYIREIVGKEDYDDVRNVMIMGGGRTSVHVAEGKPDFYNLKIIEQNEERCHRLNEILDDSDIHCAIKEWTKSDDKVLSLLARNMISRRPFKVEIYDQAISQEQIGRLEERLMQQTGVNHDEVKYLYNVSLIQKDMYDINDDHITILFKDGSMKDIAEASEILNVSLLSKKIRKYYLCYHKN